MARRKKKRIVARVSPAMEKKSLSDDRVGRRQLVPEAPSVWPHSEKRHVVTGSGDLCLLYNNWNIHIRRYIQHGKTTPV